MVEKPKVSLNIKIVLLSLVVLISSTLAMQIYAYKTAKGAIEETIGETALSISQGVVDSIDVELFQTLQAPEDMESDYYKELRIKLNEIREITGLEYLYTMRKTTDGQYIYVVDGTPFSDEEASLLGDSEVIDSELWLLSFEGERGFELVYDDVWGNLVSAYMPIKNQSGVTIGILGADFAADHVVFQLQKAKRSMLVTAGIIALLGIVIVLLFTSVLIRTLKKLQQNMQTVQAGDLTVEVHINSNDEIGLLSRAFQAMVKSMAEIIANVRNNTKHVVQYVQQLNVSINETSKASEEISQVMNEIANGASQQASSVEQVSQAMEQTLGEIQGIKKHIEMVTDDSNKAMKDAEEATEILNNSVKLINQVNDTVDTTDTMMKQLEEKFKEILFISESVAAFAKQTNLLALNASIEAARAGEHGRGFAIVAGEIKNLADNSSEASKQINELVKAIQVEIDGSGSAIEKGVVQSRDGVNAILQVEVFLKQLYQSNQMVDSRIKEVRNSIISIEQDSQNVFDNTMHLADLARNFYSSTEESAAATEEQLAIIERIRENLGSVKTMVEDLDKTVDKFKISET